MSQHVVAEVLIDAQSSFAVPVTSESGRVRGAYLLGFAMEARVAQIQQFVISIGKVVSNAGLGEIECASRVAHERRRTRISRPIEPLVGFRLLPGQGHEFVQRKGKHQSLESLRILDGIRIGRWGG